QAEMNVLGRDDRAPAPDPLGVRSERLGNETDLTRAAGSENLRPGRVHEECDLLGRRRLREGRLELADDVFGLVGAHKTHPEQRSFPGVKHGHEGSPFRPVSYFPSIWKRTNPLALSRVTFTDHIPGFPLIDTVVPCSLRFLEWTTDPSASRISTSASPPWMSLPCRTTAAESGFHHA